MGYGEYAQASGISSRRILAAGRPAEWIPVSHRRLSFTAGLALLLLATGCAAPSPDVSPAASSSAESSPVATPSAPTSTSPTPAPSIDPADYSCETILPEATLTVFQSREGEGFVLQDDFAERSRNFGSDLVYFVDFGGILCQWGYPSGTEPVDYGFSVITEEQATDRQSQLTPGGFVATDDERGTRLVNVDAVSFPETYLFADDFWFYASNPDMLDIIVTNVLAEQP
jgi:hypothetical protein